jgi:hypothetical protein
MYSRYCSTGAARLQKRRVQDSLSLGAQAPSELCTRGPHLLMMSGMMCMGGSKSPLLSLSDEGGSSVSPWLF